MDEEVACFIFHDACWRELSGVQNYHVDYHVHNHGRANPVAYRTTTSITRYITTDLVSSHQSCGDMETANHE
jgi:hypothetical protein